MSASTHPLLNDTQHLKGIGIILYTQAVGGAVGVAMAKKTPVLPLKDGVIAGWTLGGDVVANGIMNHLLNSPGLVFLEQEIEDT